MTDNISSTQLQINSKIIYQNQLVHSSLKYPELQSKLVTKLRKDSERLGILLPLEYQDGGDNDKDDHDLKFCKSCNIMFIPSITLKIRIRYSKKKNNNNIRERELVYECMRCQYENIIKDVLVQFESDKDTKRDIFDVNLNFKSNVSSGGGGDNNSIKKKKKKQKTSLSTLLNNKKLKEKEKEKQDNLFEFMKM
ncbi:hypothetical protein CANARDRAFT_30514 [[Candida] arabinofermentans NRRL YB-2248]|uniref:Uncharacterized protein n=1 Tax=[Candida] arabinofermentans NRRL YB-2248 TaxID=983967 RepID=A0A1E4STM9_9ASCO|nr:hypothetical protein CANARDRAFT_30514 [[Candida] arabinofermentans NRRL YB-2248]